MDGFPDTPGAFCLFTQAHQRRRRRGVAGGGGGGGASTVSAGARGVRAAAGWPPLPRRQVVTHTTHAIGHRQSREYGDNDN